MEVDRQGITSRANSGTPLIIIESNLLGTFYKSEISVFRTELDYQSLTTSCPYGIIASDRNVLPITVAQ